MRALSGYAFNASHLPTYTQATFRNANLISNINVLVSDKTHAKANNRLKVDRFKLLVCRSTIGPSASPAYLRARNSPTHLDSSARIPQSRYYVKLESKTYTWSRVWRDASATPDKFERSWHSPTHRQVRCVETIRSRSPRHAFLDTQECRESPAKAEITFRQLKCETQCIGADKCMAGIRKKDVIRNDHYLESMIRLISVQRPS